MKKSFFKIASLAVCIVTLVYALTMFVILLISSGAEDGYFSALMLLVFGAMLLPSLMFFMTYLDIRRGRRINWVMILCFVGSLAFLISMSCDIFIQYANSFPAANGRSNAFAFCGSYFFGQWYIPVSQTPVLVWFMARLRGRLSFSYKKDEGDPKSVITFKKTEIIFYAINYVFAMIILVGALICLVTGGGWGFVVAWMWSWLFMIPMIISMIIWMAVYCSVYGKKRAASAENSRENTN